jgi:hypothetical protein
VTKIVRAKYRHDFVLEVEFADGTAGEYDLARDTVLTRLWADPEYFKGFMIELGALGWPNGLELSPHTIRQRIEEQGKLHRAARVADSERGRRRLDP